MVRQIEGLPGWCGILDELSEIAEECPDDKEGVDVFSEAAPTPTDSEYQLRTREGLPLNE